MTGHHFGAGAARIGEQDAVRNAIGQCPVDPETDRVDPLRLFQDSAARERLLMPQFTKFVLAEPSRAVHGVSPRRVLALLRAADTLDNRNLTPPRIVMAMKGRKLSVTCFIAEDCGKSRRAFRKRKKFRLLEELLDCQIEVQIKLAHAVEAV